ncbi:hypothetical protein PTKIN_Ptkin14bG0086800 [Pterospermum kingtungense]
MAPRKESELKVSEKKHFKLMERRVHEKKEIKKLKRVKAKIEGLLKQQAKLKAKLKLALAEHKSEGEIKPTMDKLREGNRRLARLNAWSQIYIATKLGDPAWVAANTGN